MKISKKYLQRHARLLVEIKNQQQRLMGLLEIGGLGSVSFDKIPTTNMPGDPTGDIAQKIIDIQKKLDELRDQEKKEERMIESKISLLLDPYERQIIRLRYFDCHSWENIVKIMFSERNDFNEQKDAYQRRVFRIHGRALQNLLRI